MKAGFLMFLPALIGMAMHQAACGAEPAGGDTARVQESLAKWEKLRDELKGDYTYLVPKTYFASREVTTITVRGNKVVGRKFEQFGPPEPVPPGAEPPVTPPKWIEEGTTLGSHKGEGAPALTLDQCYAEALKATAAALPATHKRYVGFDARGLLGHCLIVDTRIADDAPTQGVGPIQLVLPAK